MPLEITLHQALFGYRAGHNLLAASCDLSAESRRLLAEQTDASGSWPATGFDHIITGIPLPDTSYYALFCTWPAPEMPRPGCVWSHVLLVELADLASLTDLSELRNFFKRPKTEVSNDDSNYESPLRVNFANRSPKELPFSLENDAQLFVEGLYASPRLPFVRESTDSSYFNDLVFGIWSQQWPRLRRNFSFSTGSFSDRSRAGIPFDLQIAPPSTKHWHSATNADKQQNYQEGHKKPSRLPWIETVVSDLISPGLNGLRQFLQTCGVDMKSPRNAFSILAATYHATNFDLQLDWTGLLRTVAKAFPDPTEAIKFKEWLVNSSAVCDRSVSLDRSWQTSQFILRARESRAYSKVSYDHAALVPMVWENRRDEVLSLFNHVARQPSTSSASAFITAVATAITADDLPRICTEYPELILFFFRHKHALAFQTNTWLLPEHIQWRVFETLEELSLNEQEWGKTMSAMFLTATNVAVRKAVRNAGDYAMHGAYEWLDQKIAHEFLPSQIWREALAEAAAKELSENTCLLPSHLALCSWLAHPKMVRQALISERNDVRELVEMPLEALPRPLITHTAFLLVMLGLRAETLVGITMLKKGFFQVHDALASGNYFSDSWSLLAPELPRSPVWKEWDRCEKLRRAVRQRLLDSGERRSLLEIAESAKQRELAHKIFESEIKDDDFLD